ncbi:MAG: phytanoyl-CoA dioxygenase family protein [Caldilineaceae bacterium]|nr:phytanoyl-CoA dioxygenase family protein [Caldilineaceae bacterium]
MLSAEQIAHFETFGFIIMRQAFKPQEMEAISRDFDDVLDEDRQGLPFSGEKRQAVMGCIEKRPLLTKLLEDDRIYLPIEQLLGEGFIWNGSDGNLYVGDTLWHPDGSEHDYGCIKVAFYLDPVDKDTGCLRVIPGSHHQPLHGELEPLMLQRERPAATPFGVDGANLPSFPLESEPGDVVFFDQNLWHAAFGGRTGRRMFTLNFFAKPLNEAHMDFVRSGYEGDLKFIKEMQHTQTDELYTQEFLNSESPRIQGMVAHIKALGFK